MAIFFPPAKSLGNKPYTFCPPIPTCSSQDAVDQRYSLMAFHLLYSKPALLFIFVLIYRVWGIAPTIFIKHEYVSQRTDNLFIREDRWSLYGPHSVRPIAGIPSRGHLEPVFRASAAGRQAGSADGTLQSLRLGGFVQPDQPGVGG
jgi:hypothetical protein